MVLFIFFFFFRFVSSYLPVLFVCSGVLFVFIPYQRAHSEFVS